MLKMPFPGKDKSFTFILHELLLSVLGNKDTRIFNHLRGRTFIIIKQIGVDFGVIFESNLALKPVPAK